MLMVTYVNPLCLPYIFEKKIGPRKSLQTFLSNFTIFLWILDFLDIKLCRFFLRRRWNRSEPTVLHAEKNKRKMYIRASLQNTHLHYAERDP